MDPKRRPAACVWVFIDYPWVAENKSGPPRSITSVTAGLKAPCIFVLLLSDIKTNSMNRYAQNPSKS